MKNYYIILNLDESASEEEIYTSYKNKIAQFNGLPFHTSKMIYNIKELKEAIYILGNKYNRKKYNLIYKKYDNENTKIFDRMFSISTNQRI